MFTASFSFEGLKIDLYTTKREGEISVDFDSLRIDPTGCRNIAAMFERAANEMETRSKKPQRKRRGSKR